MYVLQRHVVNISRSQWQNNQKEHSWQTQELSKRRPGLRRETLQAG